MSLPLVDQLIRSKRRTIAIIVQRDGKVIVRAPLKAAEAQIRLFVEAKASWIQAKKAEAGRQVPVAAKKFAAGEKFLFLGQEYALSVVKSQRAALRFEDGFFLHEKYQPRARLAFEKWYQTTAAEVLGERTRHLAAQFGLRFAKIRITSARTRWGSCSTSGTISYAWRLVMAPPEVIDYVVIHELAHLKVKNHSPLFWAEVARMLPGYKTQIAWLKKHGGFLTLEG